MARIINHPKKSQFSCAERFDLSDGIVIISAKPNEELTVAKALFLLEMVRAHIIELARAP